MRSKAFLLAAALLAAALPANAATPGRTSFEILMNGKPVGAHSVAVRNEGGRTIATVDINMKGKVGLFGFSYAHQCTEEWRGDTLEAMSCVDREGRDVTRVNVARTGAGLEIEGPKAGGAPVAKAIPTSWWRRGITKETRVLDTRTGELMRISVRRNGEGPISLQGKTINATHYSIRGTAPAEIWYDDQGRWVKMTFSLSGQRFEYRKTTPLTAGPIG